MILHISRARSGICDIRSVSQTLGNFPRIKTSKPGCVGMPIPKFTYMPFVRSLAARLTTLEFKSGIFFGRVWAILNWHDWTVTWEDWEWIQIYSLPNNWPCWKNRSIFTRSRCEHFSDEFGWFDILEVRGNKFDTAFDVRNSKLNFKLIISILTF